MDRDILSVVINMKRNKALKTSLYFALSVLLLTAVCVMVYTSMRNGNDSGSGASVSQQEQPDTVRKQPDELQQVSSTPHRKINEQGAGGVQEAADDLLQEASEEMTYHLVELDGYLQVYVVQTGSLYMETGILFELLPIQVQAQIREGKYFQSEETLLEFLDNYSS